MVGKIKEQMESPIKTGNALTIFIVGICVVGAVFIWATKIMADNVLNLPQKNKEAISELETNYKVQETCIEQLKNDVKEIKESTKDIQKDIKDLLKRDY